MGFDMCKDTEQFDEFLDDVYGTIKIAGCTFDASVILKELDPIAYRCFFEDYKADIENE